MLVIQGSLAAGALAWGIVAAHTSLGSALVLAAAGRVLGLEVAARAPLAPTESLDLNTSRHWDAPTVLGPLEHDEGPVLVTIEYRVEAARVPAFAAAMAALEATRRRDGAIEWELYQDTADPLRWLETFVVESWVEHLRQHERVTMSDRVLQERVYAVVEGEPRVSHFVARRGDDATE
jgi:quinol monooxygenase YgiN